MSAGVSLRRRIFLTTLLLTIAGLIVSVSTSAYLILTVSEQRTAQLNQARFEMVHAALLEPLWTLDENGIIRVGRELVGDYHIESLQVFLAESDTAVFSYLHPGQLDAITTQRIDVKLDGHLLGHAEASFKPEPLWLIIAPTLNALVILLTALTALGLWSAHRYIRHTLDSSLSHFAEWAELTLSGNVHFTRDARLPKELQPLADLLTQIAKTYTKQAQALRQFKAIAEVSSNGVIVCKQGDHIAYVNPAFTTYTGFNELDAKAISLSTLYPRDPANTRQSFLEVAAIEGQWEGETWCLCRDQSIMSQWLRIHAVTDHDATVPYFIICFSDITESKAQQVHQTQQNLFSALTGLPNRELMKERFRHDAAEARRHQKVSGILLLDLDHFQDINARYGRDVGDEFLRVYGQRITELIQRQDTVAHFGGDEFALLLNYYDNAAELRAAVEQLKSQLQSPLTSIGVELSATAAIGATQFPADDHDVDTLLRHAYYAMCEAKRRGTGELCWYDPLQEDHEHARNVMAQRLQQALLLQELIMYYQPQLDMTTGTIVGVEALIRWQHPDCGLLSPGEFLDAINDISTECALGRWVIESALNQLAQFQLAGLTLNVSINLSPNHLEAPDFIVELKALLDAHPAVDTRQLKFEIVESTALNNPALINEILRYCHDRYGIQSVLDDFGTGYSSLTHLLDLTVATVKIDRRFVSRMTQSTSDHAIVRAVISLADVYNIGVIAEGVETLAQGDALLRLGCHLAQGYFISRALPPDAIIDWIQTYEAPQRWQQLSAEVHRHRA